MTVTLKLPTPSVQQPHAVRTEPDTSMTDRARPRRWAWGDRPDCTDETGLRLDGRLLRTLDIRTTPWERLRGLKR